MIEKNEIHNVMLKLGDGNAIYLGMGEYNTIRHNYIHHVDRGSAIRTDGIAINTNFTGNIIYKCNGGFRIKRYNNHIENNILINIAQTPLALKTLMPDLGTTRIQRNIFYSTNIDEKFYTCSKTRNKGATLADKMFYGGCDVDYNMYFIVDDPQKSVAFLEKMQEDGVDKHSHAVDPLFEDVKNENFRLKPESPAFQLGFSVIDPDVIGITPDFPERFIQKE